MSTLRKLDTKTLGGWLIGSFAVGCIFVELEPFFQFFIMEDTNFLFLSILRKLETQTLGRLVIGSFAVGAKRS